ncbi:MAG: DHA1 family drug:H+ antiporter [Saliniramus fredricksonii]|uniref:Bcr/CflA family efflux transporter n=1 Tax=Saliniramus fredricksonii TaxID=1653334 RepID=A0A0N8KE14_9HYPH|nr:multidrug effflux MFS transporter [Saliniramus fredricksonii]KPQ10066.1 MAG: DHA1 family drug:H+ antiporter [Saliniramus fredricksonii]SCC80567.1 MFS transporter, DHA1 family, bicyclomycin/chloramphenicol resistance protein [Saliniramus fredricksonii]
MKGSSDAAEPDAGVATQPEQPSPLPGEAIMSGSAPVRVPSLAILVAISTLQPFALNVLAPATPVLARVMETDYATIQLTLTVYLATVAVTQLFVGPISDRIGRRPCIIGGIALFLIGSVMGAFAQSIESLLLARVVQAAGGGTCFALARAVVRDTAGKDRAASIIGYLSMAMVISPMIAPFVGGVLEEAFGWRAIFIAMVLLSAGVLVAAWYALYETAPRGASSSFVTILRGFPILLSNPAFLFYTLTLAFVSATFFGFIAGAPFVVVETMQRSPQVYGLYFIINAAGYMFGNFLTGRYGQRFGSMKLVVIGTWMSSGAMLIALYFALIGPWTPLTFFLPLTINGVGNGLTIPGATAAALSVRPDLAGTAAGLSGAAQLGTGALAAVIGGYIVELYAPGLVIFMLVCMLAGLTASRFARHHEMRSGGE